MDKQSEIWYKLEIPSDSFKIQAEDDFSKLWTFMKIHDILMSPNHSTVDPKTQLNVCDKKIEEINAELDVKDKIDLYFVKSNSKFITSHLTPNFEKNSKLFKSIEEIGKSSHITKPAEKSKPYPMYYEIEPVKSKSDFVPYQTELVKDRYSLHKDDNEFEFEDSDDDNLFSKYNNQSTKSKVS